MPQARAIVCIGIVSLFLGATTARCQPEIRSARSSFALRGGYGFAAGNWASSRVAPGVSLFAGGGEFGADLELAVSDRVTIAVEGGYGTLSGSQWEEYVRSRGDNLNVTASMAYCGLLLRPHIRLSGSDVLKLEVGPLVLFPSGSETIRGRVFEYDFFSTTRMGGEGGVEYERLLGGDFALTVRLAVIVVPSGVSYADGERRTLVSLPASAGVRVFF